MIQMSKRQQQRKVVHSMKEVFGITVCSMDVMPTMVCLGTKVANSTIDLEIEEAI